MIWRQEVPAENLVCQSQVALEDRRHLGVEVFSAAELLQHLHCQHEDLAQAVLLEVRRGKRRSGGKRRKPLLLHTKGGGAGNKPEKDACSCHETPC